ncbi:MAG: alanine racemase [Parcubacteria group bacterium]|nr:alanine racemase [Parcubacteria group bacterium]
MSSERNNLRTWIEIDTNALRRNILTFRKLIGAKTKLMAVVKSNAYGHGLWEFAKASSPHVDWFGVDTLVEAVRLRKEGIKKPILVFGYTLPKLFSEARKYNISLTISTFENIKALKTFKRRPNVHVKIDTGMHRQGFLVKQVPELIKIIKRMKWTPEGVYTHFASAKDRTYPFYTTRQITEFTEALNLLARAGFTGLVRHAAASGGALLYPQSHYDMVRVGAGLYGLWPSREAQLQYSLPVRTVGNRQPKTINLEPILSWKTVISEVKSVPAGTYVGYDLTERVNRSTKIAVLPVGYWHGVDRGLSSIGQVLVRGRRAKVLGRISMDMTVVDVTKIPDTRVGDEAVLIGRQAFGSEAQDIRLRETQSRRARRDKEGVSVYEWAEKLGTSHYEVTTRINPLIERIYVP